MGFEQFLAILFGILAGDYGFQPQKMAELKSQRTLAGLGMCILHCLIYTALTLAFLGLSWCQPLVVLVIFFSHFFIDRYSLAQKWLDLIKGRNCLKEYQGMENSIPGTQIITIPFACIVYVIVDNGMHIMLLWYGLKALVYFGLA